MAKIKISDISLDISSANITTELTDLELNRIQGGNCPCSTAKVDPTKFSYTQPSKDGKSDVLYNSNDPEYLNRLNSASQKILGRPVRFATCEEAKARGF